MTDAHFPDQLHLENARLRAQFAAVCSRLNDLEEHVFRISQPPDGAAPACPGGVPQGKTPEQLRRENGALLGQIGDFYRMIANIEDQLIAFSDSLVNP